MLVGEQDILSITYLLLSVLSTQLLVSDQKTSLETQDQRDIYILCGSSLVSSSLSDQPIKSSQHKSHKAMTVSILGRHVVLPCMSSIHETY